MGTGVPCLSTTMSLVLNRVLRLRTHALSLRYTQFKKSSLAQYYDKKYKEINCCHASLQFNKDNVKIIKLTIIQIESHENMLSKVKVFTNYQTTEKNLTVWKHCFLELQPLSFKKVCIHLWCMSCTTFITLPCLTLDVFALFVLTNKVIFKFLSYI